LTILLLSNFAHILALIPPVNTFIGTVLAYQNVILHSPPELLETSTIATIHALTPNTFIGMARVFQIAILPLPPALKAASFIAIFLVPLQTIISIGTVHVPLHAIHQWFPKQKAQ